MWGIIIARIIIAGMLLTGILIAIDALLTSTPTIHQQTAALVMMVAVMLFTSALILSQLVALRRQAERQQDIAEETNRLLAALVGELDSYTKGTTNP